MPGLAPGTPGADSHRQSKERRSGQQTALPSLSSIMLPSNSIITVSFTVCGHFDTWFLTFTVTPWVKRRCDVHFSVVCNILRTEELIDPVVSHSLIPSIAKTIMKLQKYGMHKWDTHIISYLLATYNLVLCSKLQKEFLRKTLTDLAHTSNFMAFCCAVMCENESNVSMALNQLRHFSRLSSILAYYVRKPLQKCTTLVPSDVKRI